MMGTTAEQAAGPSSPPAPISSAQIAGKAWLASWKSAAACMPRGRPVWVKANAGLPEMRDGKTHYAQTAEAFAAYMPQLVAAGAGFLGGCCGTSPDFIRAICEKLRSV